MKEKVMWLLRKLSNKKEGLKTSKLSKIYKNEDTNDYTIDREFP